MYKKICSLFVALCLLTCVSFAKPNGLSCKSALLMDSESGEILYEFNSHEKMPMASVTKIMTMLIAMEEIHNGNLKYSDIITASAYAKSMGGSTIFLDEGEQMNVEEILKGIAVSSGNDACVALAEHISGSCDAFVTRMNETAKKLGMVNTNFVNCNGLDAPNHYSTANDIAIMSRELMKYSDIFRFTTIWMDSLRNGQFTLSNTNKLIRFYPGATGLKTGSTSQAGFCISATAKRNNLHLISVIMNSPTSKERQKDASELLNYGFENYAAEFPVKENSNIPDVKIEKGKKNFVKAVCDSDIRYLYMKAEHKEPEIIYKKYKIKAPVYKGDIIGEIICTADGKTVGKTGIIADESVEKVNITFSYGKIFDRWIGNN